MLRGIYTSALSMNTQMKRLDVISNNIANVDTTGFKKDTVITSAFSEELMKRVNDPKYSFMNIPEDMGGVTLGVFVQNINTDFSTGSLKNTSDDLDVAISGSGFFTIASADKDGNSIETYSRDGSFTITPNNILVTKDGLKVLGQKGDIVIPSGGKIVIDEKGNIYSNDELIDTLKITDFENKDSLLKIGNNLYKATEESKTKPFAAKVVQGFLEGSNVSSVKEMVDMISTSRVYEANQKAITIHDTTLQRAVNDIARK